MKWIRKSLLVSVLLLSATVSKAQTWDEWMRQRKTQIKYLRQQIVALMTYADKLKDGYDIAKNGLNTVKDITNGEFNLHQSFIESLSAVNPIIRNAYQVKEIISNQQNILKLFGSVKDHELLSQDDRSYIAEVKGYVLNECEADLKELLLLTTSGKLEMQDDARIDRMEKIYLSMKDKVVFSRAFTDKVSLLIIQRKRESESINHLKDLYETN